MYLKYLPSASATALQVWQDLCALLTGTPIASLSASCDKVNSQLVSSSIDTPWVVHDAAASASAQVLKSLNTRGDYKYLHISYSSTTITLTLYETWNASTHTGTNQAFYSTACLATPQLLTVTTIGITVLVTSKNTIFTQGSSRSILVGEHSIDLPVMDSTYPCSFISGMTGVSGWVGTQSSPVATGLNSCGTCRTKYSGSAGDLKYGSTPAYTYVTTGLNEQGASSSDNLYSGLSSYVRVAGSESLEYIARPLIISQTLGVYDSAIAIGKVPELLFIHVTANHLDEIVVSGTTYVLIQTGTTNFVLIPKG